MRDAGTADGCLFRFRHYRKAVRRVFRQGMKTLTLKVPDGLLSWLENEAQRAGQPKSALVREILQKHRQRRHQSALDLAADLCGCVRSGLPHLSRNRKHPKGFGTDR